MNKQKLGHAETKYGEKLHRFVQSNYLPRQISPKNHGKKVYFTITEKLQTEHNWKCGSLLFLQSCRQHKRNSEHCIVIVYNKDTKPKKCGHVGVAHCYEC